MCLYATALIGHRLRSSKIGARWECGNNSQRRTGRIKRIVRDFGLFLIKCARASIAIFFVHAIPSGIISINELTRRACLWETDGAHFQMSSDFATRMLQSLSITRLMSRKWHSLKAWGERRRDCSSNPKVLWSFRAYTFFDLAIIYRINMHAERV